MTDRNLTTMCRQKVIFLAFTGLILVMSCKGTTEVQTHWSTDPVQIDGQMTEWVDVPKAYFEESGAQLGLRNDAENLYILFRFSDHSWVRAIRMHGLTLWLDNSAKKKKDFGIRYSGGPSVSDMQKIGVGGFWDNMTEEQKERLKWKLASGVDGITIIDQKTGLEIILPADSSGGPAAAFATPHFIYTYEFRIPLQRSIEDYGIGAQPGQAVNLGLEWGGMSKADRQRMKQNMGGRGGRGGMGGGRGGGGRGGGMRRPGMQPPEKWEIWIKTELASPASEKP